MQKKEIKKDKASILAVTLIVLGLVLSIALSASLISILGNKASISSNKSNLAYSRADSGVEDILYKIKNADSRDAIEDIVTCSDGVFENSSVGYKVEFKDASGAFIKDCGVEISKVDTIKSTGRSEGNQRSIEVAVAADAGICRYVGATPSSYNGLEVGGYSGGDAKCESEFEGSYSGIRMCTGSDFASGVPDEDGWYSTFFVYDDTTGNDCKGWTDKLLGYGSFWNSDESRPTKKACLSSYKILCCTCE